MIATVAALVASAVLSPRAAAFGRGAAAQTGGGRRSPIGASLPPSRRRWPRAAVSAAGALPQASDDPADRGGRAPPPPSARVAGTTPSSEAADLRAALRVSGFGTVEFEFESPEADGGVILDGHRGASFRYVHSKATGLLKLVGAPDEGATFGESSGFEAPRWVPIVRGEENVLVANGWSFLDPDENEPMSAFDIDAANAEGLYRPKWGQKEADDEDGGRLHLSSLGFDIKPMSSEEVLAEAEAVLSATADGIDARSVLLDGATDTPNIKRTNDGWDFSGSAGQAEVPRGVFVCAVGGLPLFATTDLSPTTASSGWLSFSRPLSDDHVALIEPEADVVDRRVEVVCARSRCHLGHYFGRGEGYCINASALNFIPAADGGGGLGRAPPGGSGAGAAPPKSRPVSWRALENDADGLPPSDRVLRDALLPLPPSHLRTAAFGAGCFWHVEAALRRLPGVVSTAAGYAGGTVASPTYEEVCKSPTGHAEAVLVEFDASVLPPRVLLDCFLAMHDPTKVRAHGKHARGTGQYRSCVFVEGAEMEDVAREALEECRAQLGKELSTEVRLVQDESRGGQWFWLAEDRHQRHDERVKGAQGKAETSTLSIQQWLSQYGRRSASVWGSGETVQVATSEPGDDGIAMMMI